MILIVNTTSDNAITGELKRCIDEKTLEAEIVECASLKISHCIGCNYCWLKTPGECSIKDDYEIILKKIIHADQLWVISDTALGFIDHKGKNIFDRILPIATMYLKFKGDQMRHVPRYDQRTDIGIIYSGEVERDYMDRWTERAALNFESRSLGVFSKEQIKEAVSCMC
ncbi:MAG: flavodoxin family protein [Lachnospiraceae bacterium]|nr:flavodoxin family protein [Lachnospiraceae bacterium]